MPAVFEALPGVEVPVSGIAAGFKKLWADSPAKESRAVQLNLVLHLGANATPADAVEQFGDVAGRRHEARTKDGASPRQPLPG